MLHYYGEENTLESGFERNVGHVNFRKKKYYLAFGSKIQLLRALVCCPNTNLSWELYRKRSKFTI
jgi:hypothetical protein